LLDIKKVRAKANEILTTKFCTACQRERNPEGGKVAITAQGRTRWKCADCRQKEREAKRKRK
jgi:hypothetical protein